jgi:hypothetical protein
MPGALSDAVGEDREDEPAGERGRRGHPNRPEPAVREPAGEGVRAEDEDVPGRDRPGRREDRPQRQAEEPALEDGDAVGDRLERVRVDPRGRRVGEAMADEPELVRDLQVVSRGGLAVPGLDEREEVRAGVAKGRPRDGGADGRVEGYDESGKL